MAVFLIILCQYSLFSHHDDCADHVGGKLQRMFFTSLLRQYEENVLSSIALIIVLNTCLD